jgi:hypothetical protein
VGLDDGFVDTPMDDRAFEQNMKLVLGSIGCSETKFENSAYESDELGSSDPDASYEERGPIYENFRKEQMHKDYKFKFGMKFNSLNDFREAIRDWSSLNDIPIIFVKNKSYRVMVECKGKCGFYMSCSKVGHKHTYAIKTHDEDMAHTCVRVLYNKSDNSKWVAKEVVMLMQTFQKVRLKDIIQHMRTNFACVSVEDMPKHKPNANQNKWKVVKKNDKANVKTDKMNAMKKTVVDDQANVKTNKGKAVKTLCHKLMNSVNTKFKRRRCSGRIKINSLKRPIFGVGSSVTQPIGIKDADEGVLTQEESTKLETCVRSMKS